tara:strand:+ start:482 stop:925 length:444 start_codon:yes stop_codon:yes gene_type:complete
MKKNKILTIALALLLGSFAFSQTLIEPEKNYYYNFQNDCAIKAVSAALEVSYKDSYVLLKDIYQEDKGVQTRALFGFINKHFPKSVLISVNYLTPSEFIKEIESTGKYLVIARRHVFFMQNSRAKSWELVGVESDFNRKIFLAIKLM